MSITPSQLSDTLMSQSAEFSSLSDQLAEVLKVKPSKWIEIRATVESDTRAERVWSATSEGIAETVIRLKLKALLSSMSAIKTRLRTLSDEAKNLY